MKEMVVSQGLDDELIEELNYNFSAYLDDHYRFLETVWHFPPDGECYETIYFGAHRITIADALEYMIKWVKKHPNAGPEEGFCPHNAMCVMEMSDDIVGGEQQSARIELSYEEE